MHNLCCFGLKIDYLFKLQKQPPRTAVKKRCSENMQQIYAALRHGCSPVDLLHIFKTPFPKNTPGWLLLKTTTQQPNYVFLNQCICRYFRVELFDSELFFFHSESDGDLVRAAREEGDKRCRM